MRVFQLALFLLLLLLELQTSSAWIARAASAFILASSADLSRVFDSTWLSEPPSTTFSKQDVLRLDEISDDVFYANPRFVEHIDAGSPIVTVEGRMVLKTLEEVGVKPDLIKMDIEGAEENLIMYSTLLKETPWLIIEWHPDKSFEDLRKQFLPDHEVVVNLENKQYLLHANISLHTHDQNSGTPARVRKSKKADTQSI